TSRCTLTSRRSASKNSMSSAIFVFFIQNARGASSWKMNSMPWSFAISVRCIRPWLRDASSSAISIEKRCPLSSTEGRPSAQAGATAANASTHAVRIGMRETFIVDTSARWPCTSAQSMPELLPVLFGEFGVVEALVLRARVLDLERAHQRRHAPADREIVATHEAEDQARAVGVAAAGGVGDAALV